MSNVASTPEFKAILKAVYDSGQAKTSGDALSMAWAEYRRKHHGGVVSVQQRRYAYRKSFENPRHYDRPHPGYKGKRDRSRDLLPCECSDRGCPVHKGSEQCSKRGKITVYRSDMEDRTGTLMCEGCAADAMDSGVFYTKNPRRKRSRKICRHCGAQMSGDVCLSCLKKNPREMRPRIQVSKRKRRGKLGARSPLKGYRINIPLFINKAEAEAALSQIKAGISVFPYHNAYISTLGGEHRASILITISLDPKASWPNGILENSHYGKFHFSYDGRLELISGYGIGKFRASVVKSVDAAIKRLTALQPVTKSNPIAVYNPRGGVKLPARNVEIRYQRSGGEYSGEWFKHPFKSSVSLIGLPDGSVLIKSNSGRKLWGKV